MPEGLTQTKTPTFSETRPEIDRNGGRLHFGMVAGFKSERWPASNRNGGRLHVGIPGRNKSESAADHPSKLSSANRLRSAGAAHLTCVSAASFPS
jgi:hypothetical protein